jgi:hypothetical protein
VEGRRGSDSERAEMADGSKRQARAHSEVPWIPGIPNQRVTTVWLTYLTWFVAAPLFLRQFRKDAICDLDQLDVPGRSRGPGVGVIMAV